MKKLKQAFKITFCLLLITIICTVFELWFFSIVNYLKKLINLDMFVINWGHTLITNFVSISFLSIWMIYKNKLIVK